MVLVTVDKYIELDEWGVVQKPKTKVLFHEHSIPPCLLVKTQFINIYHGYDSYISCSCCFMLYIYNVI